MVPYKKIDLIVESFKEMPSKRLIVIGDGPDFEKIKSRAGKNVALLGHQSFEDLVKYMQNARAFIFAAEEDFGIAPLEAQACGTPVIAYGKGGALETVIGSNSSDFSRTGIFFKHQTTESVCNAIAEFEALSLNISPEECRRNAERFSEAIFRGKFTDFVENAIKEFGFN